MIKAEFPTGMELEKTGLVTASELKVNDNNDNCDNTSNNKNYKWPNKNHFLRAILLLCFIAFVT